MQCAVCVLGERGTAAGVTQLTAGLTAPVGCVPGEVNGGEGPPSPPSGGQKPCLAELEECRQLRRRCLPVVGVDLRMHS